MVLYNNSGKQCHHLLPFSCQDTLSHYISYSGPCPVGVILELLRARIASIWKWIQTKLCSHLTRKSSMKKKRKEEKEDMGRVAFYALLTLAKHPKHLRHAVNIRRPTAVLSDNSSSAISVHSSGLGQRQCWWQRRDRNHKPVLYSLENMVLPSFCQS